MPNLDGTGPEGKGPLTGRRSGNCEGAKPCPKGQNRGLGLGQSFGCGKGLGRRNKK